MTEKTFRLAVELRQTRDLVKRLFAADYDELTKPYMDAIARWRKQTDEPLPDICLTLCKHVEKNGNEVQVLLALAASVETMEREK